jgi:hypothetical protein
MLKRILDKQNVWTLLNYYKVQSNGLNLWAQY